MNIALDTTNFTTNGVGVRSSRMDKKWCHLYWGNRPHYVWKTESYYVTSASGQPALKDDLSPFMAWLQTGLQALKLPK